MLPDDPIDIARGQPTRQSSGDPDWSRSGAATDGVFSGRFTFCTHAERDPWWEVDLGAVVPVGRIVVWNRDDAGVAGAERASPLSILISRDGAAWETAWFTHAVFGAKQFGQPLDIQTLVPLRTRFVRLQVHGTQYLHLDQVQVFLAQPPLAFGRASYARAAASLPATVRMSHDSGFFSVCSALLETLTRLQAWGTPVAGIDCSGTHTVSRDGREPPDVHAALFAHDPDAALPDLEDTAAELGPFSSSHCHWHYRSLRFDSLSPFIRRHFIPAPAGLELEARMIAEAGIDPDRTIALYYRGTDKYSEVTPTDVDRFIGAAEEILAAEPGLRVLVQSDQAQVRDAVSRHFGDRCLWFETLPVTTGQIGLHHSGVDLQQTYGISRFAMAQHFLAAVRIMARSRYVITGTTNVGLWIALYRGHAERFWQFDSVQELIRS